MPQMSTPERASLWGIRKERKRKKGWTDYIADPSEAEGTSLDPQNPGPPPPRTPPPPPPIPAPPGMFDTPPPIPPLPKRFSKPSSAASDPSSDSASAISSPSPPSDTAGLSSSPPPESSSSELSSPIEDFSTPEFKDADVPDDDTTFEDIEIEVQPDSPTHVSRPMEEPEIDWEGMINQRISRGKTNPVLPGTAAPSANSSTPSRVGQFYEDNTPAKKVERKKKDGGFDMMAWLRAGPPIPYMPNWAEEHRKFLLDRQMRQKFEPPFRLFCVREDQGSQRQPWPMPWEDSDRDPSDSEQEELARQERKAARQAKRRAKRKAIRKQERRRQREELLKQAKKLAQQEVDEARAARMDAESRDSDDEDDNEKKSFGALLLSVDSDTNDDDDDDDNENEGSEESLGTEDESTSTDEDDDSVTDMAKQLSQNSPWMKKRLSESFQPDDSDDEPQTELEKRLMKGDKFRMYDGPESDDIKICVDLKHRCLRFEGSVDDGVSMTTSSFQLKRGICDLDENKQLQPTTIHPQAGMDPEKCMTLATGRANEKGVLEAQDVSQIDAWIEGVHGLRERFLDDAIKSAMQQRSDSEEEEEVSSDEGVEVSFHTPGSSPKITPKKKKKRRSLTRDINSSESDDEDNGEERIETVIKSTYAIPLEWMIISTIAEESQPEVSSISKNLLQIDEEGQQSTEEEEEESLPEAVIHLPFSSKPKKPKRRTRTASAPPLPASFLPPAINSEGHSDVPVVLLHSASNSTNSSILEDGAESTSNESSVFERGEKTTETHIVLDNPKEEAGRTTNSRAGRTRRAAVAVKPAVPIPRHIPEDEETDSGEVKTEIGESSVENIESGAEKQMLDAAVGLASSDPKPHIQPEETSVNDESMVNQGQMSEAEKQMKALESDFGFDSSSGKEVDHMSEAEKQLKALEEFESTGNTFVGSQMSEAEKQMKALEADFGFESTSETSSIQNGGVGAATSDPTTPYETPTQLHSIEDPDVEENLSEAQKQMKALEADFGFEPSQPELKQLNVAIVSNPSVQPQEAEVVVNQEVEPIASHSSSGGQEQVVEAVSDEEAEPIAANDAVQPEAAEIMSNEDVEIITSDSNAGVKPEATHVETNEEVESIASDSNSGVQEEAVEAEEQESFASNSGVKEEAVEAMPNEAEKPEKIVEGSTDHHSMVDVSQQSGTAETPTEAQRQMAALEADFGFEPSQPELKQLDVVSTTSTPNSEVPEAVEAVVNERTQAESSLPATEMDLHSTIESQQGGMSETFAEAHRQMANVGFESTESESKQPDAVTQTDAAEVSKSENVVAVVEAGELSQTLTEETKSDCAADEASEYEEVVSIAQPVASKSPQMEDLQVAEDVQPEELVPTQSGDDVSKEVSLISAEEELPNVAQNDVTPHPSGTLDPMPAEVAAEATLMSLEEKVQQENNILSSEQGQAPPLLAVAAIEDQNPSSSLAPEDVTEGHKNRAIVVDEKPLLEEASNTTMLDESIPRVSTRSTDAISMIENAATARSEMEDSQEHISTEPLADNSETPSLNAKHEMSLGSDPDASEQMQNSSETQEVAPNTVSSRAARTRRTAVAIRPTTLGDTSRELQPRGAVESHASAEQKISDLNSVFDVESVMEPALSNSLSVETQAERQMRELEAAIGLDKFEEEPNSTRVSSTSTKTSGEVFDSVSGNQVAPNQAEEKESLIFDNASSIAADANTGGSTFQLQPLAIAHSVPSLFFSENLHPSTIASQMTSFDSDRKFEPEISLPLSEQIDPQPSAASIEQYSMFWKDTVAQPAPLRPDSALAAVAIDVPSSHTEHQHIVSIQVERSRPIGDEESDGKVPKKKDGLNEPLLLEGEPERVTSASKRKAKSICGDCVLL